MPPKSTENAVVAAPAPEPEPVRESKPVPGDLFKTFTGKSVKFEAATSDRVQKNARQMLEYLYPMLADYWEEILPKDQNILVIPYTHRVELIALHSAKPEILFFSQSGGPYMPTLHLLHKYPFMLPKHQVDIGGCKYVVSGAPVMCRGLTSPGGRIAEGLEQGASIGVYIEGKKHAVAVGSMLMSSDEIRSINSGPCIENLHHLGDGLWMNPFLEAHHTGKKE